MFGDYTQTWDYHATPSIRLLKGVTGTLSVIMYTSCAHSMRLSYIESPFQGDRNTIIHYMSWAAAGYQSHNYIHAFLCAGLLHCYICSWHIQPEPPLGFSDSANRSRARRTHAAIQVWGRIPAFCAPAAWIQILVSLHDSNPPFKIQHQAICLHRNMVWRYKTMPGTN